jgi:putative ABC transport system permease protein
MLFFVRLVLRNLFRHKLRASLSAFGIVVAVIAFSLLRTVVGAWFAGVEGTSSARLVTRNAISLVFPLPLSYANKIRQTDGVSGLSYAHWFGGVYITEKNFFPQFAIEPASYLDLYPEFVLAPEQKSAFLHDRQGCVAGRKLAAQYGWKLGDVIPIRGTLYPGNWSFVLRGIYRGADKKTDEAQFFFHWDYLNEHLKKTGSGQADRVGVYIVRLEDPSLAARVSRDIDKTFQNSLAETLTETEKAFQLSFVAMTELEGPRLRTPVHRGADRRRVPHSVRRGRPGGDRARVPGCGDLRRQGRHHLPGVPHRPRNRGHGHRCSSAGRSRSRGDPGLARHDRPHRRGAPQRCLGCASPCSTA